MTGEPQASPSYTKPNTGPTFCANTAEALIARPDELAIGCSVEAEPVKVEDNPDAEHASGVPGDWECTSSLTVSDCESWSEVASVHIEGDAISTSCRL